MLDYTGLCFLVTEDNPLCGEIIEEVLRMCHAKVIRAFSGEEAVAIIDREEDVFDAVLMDVQMPGMNGYEATQAIRATRMGAHMPVFAMTASIHERDRSRAMDAGMNDFLQKPLDLPMFDCALQRAYA